MSTNKDAVILVVITFLLAILIYRPVAKFEVYALPRKITTECSESPLTDKEKKDGGVKKITCCKYRGDTLLSCSNCVTYNDPPGLTVCTYTDAYPITASNNTGTTSIPGGITKVPPATITEFNSTTTGNAPNPSNQPPLQQQQRTTTANTCPDGSTPGANGNCPSTSPTTTSNQQATPLTEQHHHKGSNLLGGQQLTTKKGSNNNNDNSPTPSECPKGNEPIPPNCTLKPIK